ncbi:MAG TPA: V-type ATPase subunit [Myxococcaceae bacterium]|nr:V-type ATPase subunit [Myxococcaceae bacterium]
MSGLDAAIARARGLSTHLLAPAALDELRATLDLQAVAERLRTGPDPLVLTGPGVPTPEALEAAVRRRAGARLAALARWCVDVPDVLTVLLGEEDRRDLRLLLHGVVEGAAPTDRLRGTLPTPTLPTGALATLAAQTTVPAMAALLAAWRHPDAAALAGVKAPGPPDLLALDAALTRSWARRATAAAARVDAELRRYVAATIDLENALTAVMLAGSTGDRPELEPVPGGVRFPVPAWKAIAAAGSGAAALLLARQRFAGSSLERAFSGAGGAALARDRAWAAVLDIARTRARTAPLSSAPLVAYVLGVRDEVQELQRLVWGVALGAPAAARRGRR